MCDILRPFRRFFLHLFGDFADCQSSRQPEQQADGRDPASRRRGSFGNRVCSTFRRDMRTSARGVRLDEGLAVFGAEYEMN